MAIDSGKAFLDLVEKSSSILVSSQLAPDPDAICSLLLLGETLRINFPDKTVTLALDEEPVYDLHFIDGYDQIIFGQILDTIKSCKPDLIFITDNDSYDRISRNDVDAIRAIVKERGIKTAAFDHHEPTHNDELALLVNRGVAAASQEVYHLCFDVLGLQPPKGYEQMTMLAILDDTDRFKYHYPNYTETLQIAGKLIDSGIDVQKLDARLRRFTVDQMLIMGHLASNIHAEEGYTYSYISDEYAAEWVRAGKAIADIRLGRAYFVDHFIRNISDNLWGFVVFPDLTAPTGTYYASFRATRGSMNVETIGTSFGGGGHSESAGAKILAPNVDQAIRQVQAAIKQMH